MKWITLPNGKKIGGLNRLNTHALYDEIFRHDVYGNTGVEIKDGDLVFDVGANIGMFALWARERADCRLRCFEPIPEVFEVLRVNLRDNAVLHDCAIMDRNEETIFTYYPRLPELSTALPDMFKGAEIQEWTNYLRRRVCENVFVRWLPTRLRHRLAERIRRYLFKPVQVKCRCLRLDSLLCGSRVSLLKIDVEKSEQLVLDGIGDCWDSIEQIIVECYDGSSIVESVSSRLAARGFKVNRFDNSCFPELRTPLVVGRRN